MTELYEFAKQFDVIVIFILLYGFAIGSIVSVSYTHLTLPTKRIV